MNTTPQPSSPPPEAHDADDRLIHALLLHLHEESRSMNRQQRVQRAMTAIRTPAAPAPRDLNSFRIFTFRTRRALAAAAALLLIAVGLWVFTDSPRPALAAIQDIITALEKPGDRLFHIRMIDLPEPPGLRSPVTVFDSPKPGLDDAQLYLRDRSQYLLVRKNPRGGVIYDGFDGQQSWRVRRGSIAETREGPGAGGLPLPPMLANVPFSDLHQTLQQIGLSYTLEQQRDDATLDTSSQALRYVRVHRNSREVKGPQTIEIWADPQTSMPKRIVFDHVKIQGNTAPCRLTFDLVSHETLPGDWFTPQAHADPGATSR